MMSRLAAFLLIVCCSVPLWSMAQNMSVNSNGAAPDASAMLDVAATDKGVLIPRTDTATVNAATTPATGLLIYQSSDSTFYFYNGTRWQGIHGATDDQQQVDQLQLAGTILSLSLENDAEPPKTVDLSALDTDTDDQKIDVINLNGTNLELSLEDDGEATKSLDLSSLQNISLIRDADNDTRIETEQNTDEDILRFYQGGTEQFQMREGRLEVLNTGGSVFMGEGAGAADDLANHRNVYMGFSAGLSSTTGGSNVAIGYEALRSLTTGGLNIAIGTDAGELTNGSRNLFMGWRSGQLNTGGTGNIFLGYRSGQFEGGNNKLYIENSESASPLIYGEFDNDVVAINGDFSVANNVGIGTTSPSTNLDVNGTVRIRGGSPVAGYALMATDANGNATWSNAFNQTIDVINLNGNNLELSLENDGEATKVLDLSSLDSDDQTIDVLNLNGDTLELSLADDGEATKKLDLSTIGNDDQQIDVINLNGTNLELSLEDDGEATKSLDLSSLQDISLIRDADNDTRVETEQSTDEDLLRFYLSGTERFRMDGAQLEALNSGRSVFLGQNAGNNDDLSNNQNVLIGYSAGTENISGSNNIAIGYEALRSVTVGQTNNAIGAEAGELNTGSSNVFIGFRAGQQNVTGSNNVFVGHGAGRFETNSHRLYIEASSGSSPLIYGEFDNDVVAINGEFSVANHVGIGTTSPSTNLDVNGTVRIRGGSPVAGYALMATDGDGNATWSNAFNQTIDVINLNGTNLELSLANDGEATKVLDLSSLDTDTDDQKIDVINLNGTNLELSLADDGEATKVLDLSSLDTDTDDQTIDVLNLNGTNLELSLEDDGEATKVLDLSSLDTDTDDQTIDVINLNGTNLELSLEDDGQATKSVNLSSLQNISKIRDGNNDTRIETEQNTNEDIIRFYQDGTEYFQMNAGRLDVLNTGGSVFIGEGAGAADDLSTNRNVFIGESAGLSNVSGGSNVAIGREALKSCTTGGLNIVIGADAGELNNGSRNLFLGWRAGQLNSGGSDNIFLGYRAGHFEGGSNRLYIEPSSISTPLIYGEFDNDFLRINGDFEVTGGAGITGDLGVGTTAPSTTLDVNGTVRIRGGSPAAGDVLTATDGNGNASWSTALPDVGFTQTTGTTSYDNTNVFRDVSSAISVNVESGDFVKLEGQVLARLTSGDGNDPWGMKVVRTGACGSADENLIEFVPPEDSDNDHNNFRIYNYLDYYEATCDGTISFTLQLQNTGDDPWEVQDRTLIATVIRQ